MRRVLLIVVMSVLALSASAAPRSWRQMAMDALMAGDYKKAARHYEKWVEADPTDAVSLYNLACCHAVLKRPDEAMRALERATAAGWSDSAHTAEDPDLESLRGRADLRKLLSEIARNARTRYGGYTMHACPQERLGQYVIVLPEEYDPHHRYELVVLLHGYGMPPEEFAAVARFINTHDYIYAVPEGPYSLIEGGGRAFSHLRERDDFAEDAGSVDRTADWVVRVADDVAARYPVTGDKFWIVGFRQGAALAHAVAARYPARVAGYCAHGGYIIKDAIAPAQLEAERQAGVSVLITHGKEDRAVGVEEALYAAQMLRQAGVDFTLELLDVPHRFTAEVGLKVAEWLRKAAEDSPGGPR